MTEIVNLRRARKNAERAKDEAEAAANRAKFGRTKAARKLSEAETEKLQKKLDSAKRNGQSNI